MSGKTFKVKTADGESWEWEINAPDDDGKKEDKIGVEWNRPAVVCLCLGFVFSAVGLVTMLISVAILFQSSAAINGVVAGTVFICVGFIMATPSAIYVVREFKPNRDRAESVAIILPSPDYRKNTILKKPQDPKHDDERYLLAAERLTAAMETEKDAAQSVSKAAWAPNPSPMMERRAFPAISKSSLTVPSSSSVPRPRASPRIVRRIHSTKGDDTGFSSSPPQSPIDSSGSAFRPVGAAEDASAAAAAVSADAAAGSNAGVDDADVLVASEAPSNAFATPPPLPPPPPKGGTSIRSIKVSSTRSIKVEAPAAMPSVTAFEGDEEFLRDLAAQISAQGGEKKGGGGE